MTRRTLIVCVGVIVAGTGALAVLGGALLYEILTPPPSSSIAIVSLLSIVTAMSNGNAGEVFTAAIGFAWAGAAVMSFGPIAVAAVVGEVTASRSLTLYAAVAGGMAAAGPALLRVILQVDPVASSEAALLLESRFLLAAFLSGTVGGGLYWLLAGRSAAGRG
ncbi:hypothetical protein LGH83_12985 [Lichenihabitans sp. PAMC28606]|uniref:hypothetical protein n=1 Tax=Lichenihabitans sp. PAMC28606 TaxID=2880932 RepID=UPI001D0ADE15|nr:hypothetical protein [Lichenihabitans sp. PAMC28606]UDL93497.1 hypothetical protein LGH83_12985 [Lichenihabitans sp. PAMC28606]